MRVSKNNHENVPVSSPLSATTESGGREGLEPLLAKRGSKFTKSCRSRPQPAKQEQVVAKPSKRFFSFLFASLSQFAEICRDLYYVFTTVAFTGLVSLAVRPRTRQSLI